MATPTTNFGFLKPTTAELYDVNTYDSNLDAIDAAINSPSPTQTKLPLGQVAEVELTTVGGAINTLTILQNIASFTFKAGRWYLVEATGTYQSSSTDSTFVMTLNTASTSDSASLTTGLTQIRQWPEHPNVAGEGRPYYVARRLKYASDTTLQIKLAVQRVSGTGNYTQIPNAQDVATLAIIDEGKAM